ncbi:TspO/MBR family protein [Frigidibacter sp. SD6-1]|uniref:TspO/MBR family protein n=1 Tax=Frigidibacter sp. SD6-1 TaxID=3032581 RepID=UPI0024DF7FCC|nr:TspO/MBR family protein [Frigidibacter sp. SD6-1]
MDRTNPKHSYLALAIFLAIVMGGGLFIGTQTAPGPWYAALAKPWFNPPNWLFGPVWSVLYLLMAIVGWRTWRRAPAGTAMRAWYAQLVLNFLWSPMFFLVHRIDAALAIIVALFAAIAVLFLVSWRQDRPSAWMLVPYALWVGFATLLNAALLMLNGPTG